MQHIEHVSEFTQILTYIIWASEQPTCSQKISGAIVSLLQCGVF